MKIISTITTMEEVKEIEHFFQDYTTLTYDIEKGNITLPFILYSVENDNGDDYYIFDEFCINLLEGISLDEEDLQILINKYMEIR